VPGDAAGHGSKLLRSSADSSPRTTTSDTGKRSPGISAKVPRVAHVVISAQLDKALN